MHFFGEGPLTETQQRTQDLRESGWTGPIDHNGDPVDDMDGWLGKWLRW